MARLLQALLQHQRLHHLQHLQHQLLGTTGRLRALLTKKQFASKGLVASCAHLSAMAILALRMYQRARQRRPPARSKLPRATVTVRWNAKEVAAHQGRPARVLVLLVSALIPLTRPLLQRCLHQPTRLKSLCEGGMTRSASVRSVFRTAALEVVPNSWTVLCFLIFIIQEALFS